jgi:hypothetical protein
LISSTVVRLVYIALLILQTACAGEQYWVYPAELTRARVQKTEVDALRDENERPARVPANRLLELDLTPSGVDGRILVTDWRVRRRHQRRAFLGVGITLLLLGIPAFAVGAAWTRPIVPCSQRMTLFGCLDFLDYVGPGLLAAGIPMILVGAPLTIAGALTRVPRD